MPEEPKPHPPAPSSPETEGAADPPSPQASLFTAERLKPPLYLDFPSLLPQLLGDA